jgi:heme exporter protein C
MSVVSNTPIGDFGDQLPVNKPNPAGLRILTIISIIGVIIALGMGFFYAGTDATQGNVQRLFYIHMTSFFGAFLAFGATVLGGIQYLRTRKLKWDTLALSGVEVGLALSLVNLFTGIFWMRPIWNTWWVWDPRLTCAAIMCLTYAAYLVLRNGIENPDRRRRLASIYGILAIVTVILTLVIIRIRPDTIHPTVIGDSPPNAEGTPSMSPSMVTTLLVNLPVWGLLVPVTLMWFRIRLQNSMEHLNAYKARILNQ